MVIAVLAVALALAGEAGIGVLLAIAIVAFPIVTAGRGRRFKALTWVLAVYPALVLITIDAAWCTAWLSLGHRPGYEDPHSINALVTTAHSCALTLLVGIPLDLLLGLLVAPMAFVSMMRRTNIQPVVLITKIFAVITTWIISILIHLWLGSQSGSVEGWFFGPGF